MHLGYTEDGIAVNSYFVEHPEMILGRMQYDTRIYGQDSRYTVCVNDDPNFNMYEALNKAISNMQAELTDFERLTEEEEKSEDIIPADPDVRNFSYCFVDGKLYFRENSQMVRREVSATVEERIKALDEIRTVTRHLIDIQTEGCSEEELADVQRLLNERYDRFVDKYGSINSQGNSRAFRDDSDYPLLCSLEEIDEDGNVKKADMFYKQTIKAKVSIERVETAVDTLNVSINEFGTVNLAYMQSIYHPDISDMIKEVSEKTGKIVEEINLSEQLKADFERQKMIKELEGLIFLNPSGYNPNNPNAGWEAADEYLSGNVRDKLRVAKAMMENPDLSEEEKALFTINVSALEQVQPKDLDASEIDVRIGTTWIGDECFPFHEIDINFKSENGARIEDVKDMLKHTMRIENSEYGIRTLDVDSFLIFLCIHHYREATMLLKILEGEDLTLYKYLDIHVFIKQTSIDWAKLISKAKLYDKEIEVYHTLWYTEHIYPGTIPNSVFSMFELKDYDFVDEYNVKDNSHERIKWKLDFYHRLFNVERRKEALEAAKDESEKLKK